MWISPKTLRSPVWRHLPQVVWPTKPLHSIRGSLPAWPPNGINHMLQRCLGYAAVLSSPCYGQLYNASGVLVLALDTPPSPLLHQWTRWLTLNWPLSKLLITTPSYKICFLFHTLSYPVIAIPVFLLIHYELFHLLILSFLTFPWSSDSMTLRVIRILLPLSYNLIGQ